MNDGVVTRDEALRMLGLADGADERLIAASFRRVIALHHPDRGGDPDGARRVLAARDVLLHGASESQDMTIAQPTAGGPRRRQRSFTRRRRLRLF